MNGTIDGYESFDGMLPVFAKYRIGADPFVEDTDEDGLTDSFKLLHLGLLTDVVSNDTDEDGILDPAEDPDDDTLTNLQVQGYGTEPLLNDTAKDGILDPEELHSNTKPCDANTDNESTWTATRPSPRSPKMP